MKYTVIETIEREINFIGSFNNHKEAKKAMAKAFYKFHKNAGREKEILPEKELVSITDKEFDDWYFSDDSAWSNVDNSYNYDIKIIEEDTDRSDVLLYNAITYIDTLVGQEPNELKNTMMNELGMNEEEYNRIMG